MLIRNRTLLLGLFGFLLNGAGWHSASVADEGPTRNAEPAPTPEEVYAKVLTEENLKRLAENAYWDPDAGGAESREAPRLPAARPSPSTEENASIVRQYDQRRAEARRKVDWELVLTYKPEYLLPVQVYGLELDRGGTFATFDFSLTAPGMVLVGMKEGGLSAVSDGDGGYDFSTAPDHLALALSKQHHTVSVVNLKPDTTYDFVIKIYPDDAWRDWSAEQGSLKTFTRHIIVTVPSVYMIDDADWGGAGEVQFRSQIGHPGFGFWWPGNSWDFAGTPMPGGYVEVSSGTWYQTSFTLWGHDVGEKFEHTFGVIEEDDSNYGSMNEADKYAGNGDWGHVEFNSGHWTYYVNGGTYMSPGPNLWDREMYQTNFFRHVAPYQDETDLEYDIHGSIVVLYWPTI